MRVTNYFTKASCEQITATRWQLTIVDKERSCADVSLYFICIYINPLAYSKAKVLSEKREQLRLL